MEETKPGWKTTEFWMTLGMSLISVGVIVLQLTPAQQAEAGEHWSKTVTAVTALIGSVAMVWRYIESRRAVKETAIVAKQIDKDISPNLRSGT